MTKMIYEAKQQWLEKVMASSLSHAEKTFAFVIYKCAYGDKIESFPDTDVFKEQGGFTSHGHFTQYRERLIASGAVTAVLGYHSPKAKTKNYTYTLNLDWDGTVAPKETQKKSPSKASKASMAPTGRAMAPEGQSGGTSGTSGGTRGDTNTSINTSTLNTSSNTTKTPAAPVDSKNEDQEDDQPSLEPQGTDLPFEEPTKEDDSLDRNRHLPWWTRYCLDPRQVEEVRPLNDEEKKSYESHMRNKNTHDESMSSMRRDMESSW